ncbi:helix-turn-helix domain-containing protein [Amycolatopsis pithecellobii]|uniref:LysR family transcriptional regulator n=1 Tax=Amycolatopsis pithecellobii TaxID=664692 RepID=A0A6N7Z4V8_9PSEU|nr:LysR family transcriptional regulator [Amycolatopsis pithecellobii]MTD54336.1 LysR family transcriptional regulator [Amycolatopsis pithecellobii]
MHGLLLRLSALDADAENAVRLISFFDSLVEQQAKLEELLRSAAVVAECAVGLQDVDGQFAARALPDGTFDAERAGTGAAVRKATSGHQVWLSRGGARALPMDDMLLERLAIACIATLGRSDAPSPLLGDPALLELVVGRSAGAPERTRALHLLGLKPCTQLTMLAVLGPVECVDAFAMGLNRSGAAPRRAIIGSAHAMAITGALPADLTPPAGVTVGVGTSGHAVDAPSSWEKALRALRYATAGTARTDAAVHPVVFASDLGPFELLAGRLRSADIVGVADIDVLDQLAEDSSGLDVLRALEVVVEAGSLREAARKLHLHHNSVSARVARAEERLGYRVTEPSGIARLGLALALRRLRDTDLLA